MAQEHNNNSAAKISDKRLFELGLTELGAAQGLVASDGNESFIPSLLEVVRSNTEKDYSDIGMAIRAVLREHFGPIIQSRDFQSHVVSIRSPRTYYLSDDAGSSKSQDMKIPHIYSADALIDFYVKTYNSKGPMRDTILHKAEEQLTQAAAMMHNMRVAKYKFGIDLAVLESEFKQLQHKAEELKEEHITTTKNIEDLSQELLAELKKSTEQITMSVHPDSRKKAEKTIKKILKYPVLLGPGKLDPIKKLITPEEFSRHFGKLEKDLARIDSMETESKKCYQQIHLNKVATKDLKAFLASQQGASKIPPNAATYEKVLLDMLKLTALTCEPSSKRESATKPTYQIQSLAASGQAPALQSAVKIVAARDQDLKPAGLKRKLAALKIEEKSLMSQRQEASEERAARIEKLLAANAKLQKNIERNIADTEENAAIKIQQTSRAFLARSKFSKYKAKATKVQIEEHAPENMSSKLWSLFSKFIAAILAVLPRKKEEESYEEEDPVISKLHPEESHSLGNNSSDPLKAVCSEKPVKQNKDEDGDGDREGPKRHKK